MNTYPRFIIVLLTFIHFSTQHKDIYGTNTLDVYSGNNYKVRLKPQPADPLQINLNSDNKTDGFYVVQIHSQLSPVVMSLIKDTHIYGEHETGLDIGVVMASNRMNNSHVYCSATATKKKTCASVIPITYSIGSPIPGGCCSVCALEIDPNLSIDHSTWLNSIHFQRANVYNTGKKTVPCDSISGPDQKIQTHRLEYTLHVLYFGDWEYSNYELEEALWKLSTPDQIKKYGQKGATVKGNEMLVVKAVRMQGQGIVYNILVRDPITKEETAYVPMHTYGCNITDHADCRIPFTRVPIQLTACIVGGIIGMAMCFLGNKLMKTQIFLGGTVAGGVVSFLLLDWLSNWSLLERTACSLGAGAVLGCLLLLIYTRDKFIHLCLIPNALVLCLLIQCVIFFSDVAQMDVWSNREAYWLTVSSIVFLPAIVLIIYPKFLSILNTSLVGSYAFVVMISFFVRCNVSYIVLNFFMKTSSHFGSSVFVGRPFTKVDYILVGVWVCLALSGILFQYYTSKPKRKRFVSTRRKPRRNRHDNNEKTCLLANEEEQVQPPTGYQSINSIVNVV